MNGIFLKRTTSNDDDFQLLVKKLDYELWVELLEDQATYYQYNKVPDIPKVVVPYYHDDPVACGCFKWFDRDNCGNKKNVCLQRTKGQRVI